MNILIDCGTHLGQGMETFIKKYGMTDKEWQIFTFEPNRETFGKLDRSKLPMKNITFSNKAVWINEKEITFNAETPPQSSENTGQASSLIDMKDWKPKTPKNQGSGEFNNSYEVSCVHLSTFIKENFKTSDKIVLKLDIEGAEFAVLRDMIDTGAIRYIDDLYVEFHEWAMASESRWSKYLLIARAKIHNPRMRFTVWH